MTIPEHKTKTTSTDIEAIKRDWKPAGSLPVVTSISDAWLTKNGWMVFAKYTWVKNGHTITYDGATFCLDKKTTIQFTDELPK